MDESSTGKMPVPLGSGERQQNLPKYAHMGSAARILDERILHPVLTRGLRPFAAVVIGKLGVAGDAAVDFCDEQLVGQRQGGFVHLAATDNENGLFILPATMIEGSIEAGKREHSGRRGEIRALGEDNVRAARQRFADGFIRLPSHDDGMAHGEAFEPLQIFADMPGDLSLVTDRTVFADGDDQRDVHTATLNLILGWG